MDPTNGQEPKLGAALDNIENSDAKLADADDVQVGQTHSSHRSDHNTDRSFHRSPIRTNKNNRNQNANRSGNNNKNERNISNSSNNKTESESDSRNGNEGSSQIFININNASNSRSTDAENENASSDIESNRYVGVFMCLNFKMKFHIFIVVFEK